MKTNENVKADDKQAMPQMKPTADAVRQSMERAAASFMTFTYGAGKSYMTKTLPDWVKKQIIQQAADNNDLDNTDAKALNMSVNLFGPYQRKFYDACIGPQMSLYNKILSETIAQHKGAGAPRMLPTLEIFKKHKGYEARAKDCLKKVNDFAEHLDTYEQAGRRQCDRNFPYDIRTPDGRTMKVSDLLEYPSRKAFIEKFYIKLGLPTQLTVFDMDRAVDLPPGYARKLAAAQDAETKKEVDMFKRTAISAAVDALDGLSDQINKGKGLRQSKVEAAVQAAESLKQLNAGYEQDAAIDALADTVITRARKAAKAFDSFKLDSNAQADVQRATDAVAAKLAKLAGLKNKERPNMPKAKPKKAAPKKSTKPAKAAPVGGMMANL